MEQQPSSFSATVLGLGALRLYYKIRLGALALRIQSKFQNDPQPIRVFTDEMLAARFGLALGVPMPRWREVITGAESKFSGDRGRRMLLLARMIEFKRHVNERRRYKVQGQPLP